MWNEGYDRDLAVYWISRQRNNWVKYREIVKMAKELFQQKNSRSSIG